MDLSKHIEYTSLQPDCTTQQIKQICTNAIEHNLVSVCIPPFYVRSAASYLAESPTKVVTVVGYPMGYSPIPSKVEEVKRAIGEGADEIEMVANICAVKDGKWAHVRNDIDSVTRATHLKGKALKVIIEMHLLNKEEIEKLCELCAFFGVEYIQTSTLMANGEQLMDDVRYLKGLLPANVKIKVVGDIKGKELAQQLISAGAERIGSIHALQIVGQKNVKQLEE